VLLALFVVESLVLAIITLAPYLPGKALLGFHIALIAVLLAAALLLRRSPKGQPYWLVCYALFVAGAAVLLSGLLADRLLGLLRLTPTNPQGIAVAKFLESLLRVIAVLVLVPLGGQDWRSLYLSRGKPRIFLTVGLAAWIVFPLLAFLPLSGQGDTLRKLFRLAPWILLFVFSNGFMEELLFRGLFLKRYEAHLGKGLANVLTAVVFTLMHIQVTYAPQMLQFLAIAMVLSLIWGYLIQKTDSLWGAVLFHAAGDCLIVFPIFATYAGL
jgi:membrane protease YdiL (CAAX protease family)